MTKTKNFRLWCILGAMTTLAGAALFAFPALAADASDTVIGISKPWQMGFQEAGSTTKEHMEWFHNKLLMPIITGIMIFVTLLLAYVMFRFRAKANPVPSKTTHNTMLEVVWTLIPVLILVVIVIPSMKMLYYIDKTKDAEMTLKVTGFQWYWGYEYPDHGDVNFLSNMVADKDLKEGEPRLLKTDNAVVLPIDTNIRLLITAADVIHSWALPALGVKLDAVPGRLNETWVRIEKEGTYYGQCSELCGINHAYMPIEIKAVSKANFAKWVAGQGGKMPEVTAVTDAVTPAEATEGENTGSGEAPIEAADKEAGEE